MILFTYVSIENSMVEKLLMCFKDCSCAVVVSYMSLSCHLCNFNCYPVEGFKIKSNVRILRFGGDVSRITFCLIILECGQVVCLL